MTIDHSRPPRAKRGTLPAFTPVPRHYQRHDGWTPERQLGFIEALADLGSVRAAALAVNMTPEGAYLLRRHPEAKTFRKAWEAALALGVQRIEDVAMDRALNGVEVPVYSYGKLVGTRTVVNDRLLMFMLRNRAPKRFSAARAMSAVDSMMMVRLKKQWRAEWEAERQAREDEEEDAILDALDAKILAMREREEEAARLLLADLSRGESEDADGGEEPMPAPAWREAPTAPEPAPESAPAPEPAPPEPAPAPEPAPVPDSAPEVPAAPQAVAAPDSEPQPPKPKVPRIHWL